MKKTNSPNWSSIVVGACCLTLAFGVNAESKPEAIVVTYESTKTVDSVALVLAELSFTDLITKNTDRTFDVEGAVKVDLNGARALFEQGAIFIDSRANYRYESGHIPGATNLYSFGEFNKSSLSKLVELNQEVVFYCGGEDCNLSANSSAKALTWGYTKVYYFAEGYPAWYLADYPVEVP